MSSAPRSYHYDYDYDCKVKYLGYAESTDYYLENVRRV